MDVFVRLSQRTGGNRDDFPPDRTKRRSSPADENPGFFIRWSLTVADNTKETRGNHEPRTIHTLRLRRSLRLRSRWRHCPALHGDEQHELAEGRRMSLEATLDLLLIAFGVFGASALAAALYFGRKYDE